MFFDLMKPIISLNLTLNNKNDNRNSSYYTFQLNFMDLFSVTIISCLHALVIAT